MALEQNRVRFNALTRNVASIEHCAAALEGMRLQFSRLGQRSDEVIGGYTELWRLDRSGALDERLAA